MVADGDSDATEGGCQAASHTQMMEHLHGNAKLNALREKDKRGREAGSKQKASESGGSSVI